MRGPAFLRTWGLVLTASAPNGCMIAEVEVDPETGAVDMQKLFAVDDVGVVVNPLTLHGQLHGSIAQGLGESLIEQMIYDRETGQLLTGSFIDYGMPRADIMPDITSDLSLDPAKTNPLGCECDRRCACAVGPRRYYAAGDA
jgi:carbon-monoxide dehydrogenase large subunit